MVWQGARVDGDFSCPSGPGPHRKKDVGRATPPGESAQGSGPANNLLRRLQILPQQYNEIRWLSFR
jgi:hypothetical protein